MTVTIITVALAVAALIIAPLTRTYAQKGKPGSNLAPPEEYLDGVTIEHPFVGTKAFGTFDTASVAADSVDWAKYANNLSNSGFSDLTQINRSNVGSLKVQFIFSTGTIQGGSYQCRPLEIGGILYTNQQNGSVWALDAQTGRTIWTWQSGLDTTQGPRGQNGTVNRGLGYASDIGPNGTIYVGIADQRVAALDALTGKPLAGFGDADGTADGVAKIDAPEQNRSVTVPPQYYNGRIYVVMEGSSRMILGGLVLALDARTGQEYWRFSTIPQGPADEGWDLAKNTWLGPGQTEGVPNPNPLTPTLAQRSGGGVWQTPAIDPDLGLIYFGTGDSGPNGYGGNRVGANLFGCGIVALHTDTGKIAWFFQVTHHDVWDYDIGSTPVLVDVNRGGKITKAVAVVGKTSFVHVLDRATGKPVYATPETPVPTDTNVPGEVLAPTQPIPATEPFCPVWPVDVPAERILPTARYGGIYNATWTGGSIFTPHYLGGVNFGASSYNAQVGHLYIGASDQPQQVISARVGLRNVGQGAGGANSSRPLRDFTGILVAWDVNTGRVVWRRNYESRIQAGCFATAGGLVFVGEANGLFHAVNSSTGEELFTFNTGAGIYAEAISYMVNGKQYIAICSGGAGQGNRAGNVIVFALP
jgi:alcohol dehydrogenase (cytochrome c)